MPYPKKVDLTVRFWKYVDRTTPFGPKGDCWKWIGKPVKEGSIGYGRLGERSPDGSHRIIYAHRLSYEIHKGKIPTGHQVAHLCHVKLCVNPTHLIAVTPKTHGQHYSKPARGEEHGSSKLTDDAVREIRRLYGTPLPPDLVTHKAKGIPGPKFTGRWTEKHLAIKFGVQRLSIHRVLTGEGWNHVT